MHDQEALRKPNETQGKDILRDAMKEMKTYWQKQNASKEETHKGTNFHFRVWRDIAASTSKGSETNLGENYSQQKQKSLLSSIVNFVFFLPEQASFLFFKFLPRKCSQLRKLDEMTWVFTILFFNYSTSWVFKINSRVKYGGSGAQHG